MFSRVKKFATGVTNTLSIAGGLRPALRAAAEILHRDGLAGLAGSIGFVIRRAMQTSQDAFNGDYASWIAAREVETLQRLRAAPSQIKRPATVSIVLPIYKPDLALLEKAVDSVFKQTFDNWQLILVDDYSESDEVTNYIENLQASDSKVICVHRSENGHIATSTNNGVAHATGEFVTFLDQDDELATFAIEIVSRFILANPNKQFFYSDEDKISPTGRRFAPHFKPSMNPELALAYNFFCHLTIYRRELFLKLGGMDPKYPGAQDYEMSLRAMRSLGHENIVHIPVILYHWRATALSTATNLDTKPYARVSSLNAVKDHLAALNIKAEVTQDSRVNHANRITYATRNDLRVSIIIPTRDRSDLLEVCIASIQNSQISNYEIVIIDNGSVEAETALLLAKLKSDGCIVLEDPGDFNFSRLCNAGAAIASGEILIFLNNDIEVLSPNWAQELISVASLERSGAVGARLWYPDMTLQHGGVILGINGSAGHAHKHLARNLNGYASRAVLRQNFSAVTGACLAVSRTKFIEVGGFDSGFAVGLNDIDLCLKLQKHGYLNVWTPYSELIHHESKSRGKVESSDSIARAASEVRNFSAKWGIFNSGDPFYNPNLTLSREDFSFM